MSDSIVKFYVSWANYFAKTITPDAIALGGMVLLGLIAFFLLVYKFASYDSDVLYASKSVLEYLRASKNKRTGSLNYYMRCFPTNVFRAWERYYAKKEGKPSDYISVELVLHRGFLEESLQKIMPITTVIAGVLSLAYALCYQSLPINQILFLPLLLIAFGSLMTLIVNAVFDGTKKRMTTKFQEMIKTLNFYASNNFDEGFKPTIPCATMKKPQEVSTIPVEKKVESVPLPYALEKATNFSSQAKEIQTLSDNSLEKKAETSDLSSN